MHYLIANPINNINFFFKFIYYEQGFLNIYYQKIIIKLFKILRGEIINRQKFKLLGRMTSGGLWIKGIL